MIKRLIFDINGTLILHSNYHHCIENTLKKSLSLYELSKNRAPLPCSWNVILDTESMGITNC